MILTSLGLRAILSSLLLTQALGAVLTDASQLRRDRTYDYIVVGAGTAGNVIVDRLSEKGYSVLVLEAGGSHEGILEAQVPLLAPRLTPGTIYDWNYTVVPQEGLFGRTFPFHRGKMLGGTSSVNYMVHHFGSSEDYDKMARDTGDRGLSWANMRKYIYKHERIVPPADGHDTTGQLLPQYHGTRGAVSVSVYGYAHKVDEYVIETTKELSDEFPYVPDMGHGNGQVLGLGYTQHSIGNGTRSSSATTYLQNALKRRGVDVLINAHVTKLVQTGTKKGPKGKPIFKQVQFAKGPGAPLNTVNAKREIILSAGAVGSPQILMLSGIGPKDELEPLGIKTIVDLPSVGKNMSDHMQLGNVFYVRGDDSLDGMLRDNTRLSAAIDQWKATRQGPLVNGVSNNLGFFRLPDTLPIFQKIPDPAPGPTAAHWEMVVVNYHYGAIPATGSYMSLVSLLISPTSRGYVNLASKDPFAAPIIDPRYLTTEFDIVTFRESVRACKRFAASNAFKPYVIGPKGELNETSDEGIDAFVRKNADTVWHPVGTTSMTARNAQWGVVDPDFKVKGVEGIRVVDAGVWSFVPTAHTQGPTYMMAERAGDIIG